VSDSTKALELCGVSVRTVAFGARIRRESRCPILRVRYGDTKTWGKRINPKQS